MDASVKPGLSEVEESLEQIPLKLENLPIELEGVSWGQSDESAGASSAALWFKIRESQPPELDQVSQRRGQGDGTGFTDHLMEESREKYDMLIQHWPGFLAEQEHPYAWRLVPLTWEENGQSKLTICMPECRIDKTVSSALLSWETPEAMPLLSHCYRSPNAKIQVAKLYHDSSITVTATNLSLGAGQVGRITAMSIDFGSLPHLGATGYLLPEYKDLGLRLGKEFLSALTQATGLAFDVSGFAASGPLVIKDEEV